MNGQILAASHDGNPLFEAQMLMANSPYYVFKNFELFVDLEPKP